MSLYRGRMVRAVNRDIDPALKESIPNSSAKYSRMGFSFINLSLLSSKLGAY
jgi:hypothetical protein